VSCLGDLGNWELANKSKHLCIPYIYTIYNTIYNASRSRIKMNHVLLILVGKCVNQKRFLAPKISKVRRTIWGFFPVNLAKKKGIKHDSRQRNNSGNEECLKKCLWK
jgi:hypothetical protein